MHHKTKSFIIFVSQTNIITLAKINQKQKQLFNGIYKLNKYFNFLTTSAGIFSHVKWGSQRDSFVQTRTSIFIVGISRGMYHLYSAATDTTTLLIFCLVKKTTSVKLLCFVICFADLEQVFILPLKNCKELIQVLFVLVFWTEYYMKQILVFLIFT